jgi:hypothetical protein
VQLDSVASRGSIAVVNPLQVDLGRESNLADMMTSAERELGAFISAVTASFGPQEARIAVEDWLEELELMDPVSKLSESVWRTITIASAARLAVRLCTRSNDTKVSPIRSSNCLSSKRLA